MKTTIAAGLASALLSTEPVLAQPTYAPVSDPPPVGVEASDPTDAPQPSPSVYPAKLAKPAPRWMVAATETGPTYAVPPAAIKPVRTTPKDWRPSKRWALGVTIGSDGAGAEAQFLATRAIVLRVRAAFLNIDHAQTYDQVRYNGHVRLSNAGAYLDLHLLDGMLHPLMLSGGVVSAVGGRRHVGLDATPQGSFSLGGHTYTAAQLGAVTGNIGLDTVAPFAGVGFDNTFDTKGPFGFKLLAGVVFSGDPKVNLQSTGGLLSNTTAVLADIQSEEAKIRSAAQVFQYYPAISTGLTYKF
jgi:hypothetical protein